ncbi:hypothetical protein Pmani_036928 [Petrolisthes manimaculis]|uniref:Uncharacterized protein n=1 Tax=Petrolisthes manimaculis TaxID=1843537 RepID=A0AAE1TNY1_9EUCA|nr:hypothetical protein Pmani_036928 [Petrolisthes manimaculis]
MEEEGQEGEEDKREEDAKIRKKEENVISRFLFNSGGGQYCLKTGGGVYLQLGRGFGARRQGGAGRCETDGRPRTKETEGGDAQLDFDRLNADSQELEEEEEEEEEEEDEDEEEQLVKDEHEDEDRR